MLESRSGREAVGDAEIKESQIFADWVSASDSLLMLYYNVETDTESRDSVFSSLAAIPHTVLTDMGYYSRQMARQMVDDFNWLLLLSSIIVAAALIASYGRVELFLLTFTPMCVSWVIILGLMAIFGVEFNVVNIILSTFIFGVGDDYAIFIMDGLQAGYSRGQKIMASHKTAIVLSAFAAKCLAATLPCIPWVSSPFLAFWPSSSPASLSSPSCSACSSLAPRGVAACHIPCRACCAESWPTLSMA